MDHINSATADPAQDITSRLENALYGEPEPEHKEDDVALEDDTKIGDLPEDDDTESNEDDGSDELKNIAEEVDLTLSEYLGVDNDRIVTKDDGSVVFNAIIDGEKKEIPLKDLASSYQMQGHVNNKSMALETERKEFEEQKTAISQKLTDQIGELDNLGKALEQQLVSEFQSVDWDALRIQDSAEWTALRQEYAEKAQNIQRMQDGVKFEAQKISKEQEEAFNKQNQELMFRESQLMVADNPTWSNEKVLSEDMTKLRTFMNSQYGYTEEDLSNISDHRVIKVIQDAMAYREGSKAAVEKKVKNVPRFQKPGAAKANATQLAGARKIKANRAAVKKSGGHVKDVARLLEDRM
jgi:hypothetical protein